MEPVRLYGGARNALDPLDTRSDAAAVTARSRLLHVTACHPGPVRGAAATGPGLPGG